MKPQRFLILVQEHLSHNLWKGRSCCSFTGSLKLHTLLAKQPLATHRLPESHWCCVLVSLSLMPAESRVTWPLNLGSPWKLWAKKDPSGFLDTSKIRRGLWIQLLLLRHSQSPPNLLCCYLLVFFCVSGLQDSDSPRHSTASNSSNLSSPPSPVSPHKTKSLSLESSDHVSWDSWTASAFRFGITSACCPHGCPLHLLQFSPSSS